MDVGRHSVIVDVIETGDADEASKAIQTHMDWAAGNLVGRSNPALSGGFHRAGSSWCMTENLGTRAHLVPGDTVLLHPQGVSKFKILSIDEDGHALIESLLTSPGTYPFSVQTKFLVPADS
jgi:hypothetical protein